MTLSVFTRALLNFAGLAVLIPVLVIILDTEGIRSNRWLAALYDFGGFTSDRTFILTVCACVVAVILFKSLANLALYKIERNFIYDLYRELSRRLYVDYRNRGLGFIKSSNSAVLARNVNVVCLTFVTGVLMPVAAMASEAVLFALLFGSLAIYNPLVALLTLAIFVPSVALYYYLVRQRLNRYGEEDFRNLLDVQRADNMGQAKKFHYRQQDIDRVEALLNAELARGSCFTLKQLAINGNDLKPLGYRGPELGRVLQMLLDRVMDGRLSNNREDLLAEAEKLKTN